MNASVPGPTDPSKKIRVSDRRERLGGISESTFNERLELGRIPQPDGHDPEPYWRVQTVKNHFERQAQPKPSAFDEAGFPMLVEGMAPKRKD